MVTVALTVFVVVTDVGSGLIAIVNDDVVVVVSVVALRWWCCCKRMG